jgi:hypothetical protein
LRSRCGFAQRCRRSRPPQACRGETCANGRRSICGYRPGSASLTSPQVQVVAGASVRSCAMPKSPSPPPRIKRALQCFTSLPPAFSPPSASSEPRRYSPRPAALIFRFGLRGAVLRSDESPPVRIERSGNLFVNPTLLRLKALDRCGDNFALEFRRHSMTFCHHGIVHNFGSADWAEATSLRQHAVAHCKIRPFFWRSIYKSTSAAGPVASWAGPLRDSRWRHTVRSPPRPQLLIDSEAKALHHAVPAAFAAAPRAAHLGEKAEVEKGQQH